MKKLYKIEEGKKICGVCGGVAEYFNIDPTIVRIIIAVLCLAYGTGILIYFIAALVMPNKSDVVKDDFIEGKYRDVNDTAGEK